MIDTHIHLDLMHQPKALLAEARQAGVDSWIVPGVSSKDWAGLMATVEAHEGLYAAPGIHPRAAAGCEPRCFEELQRLLDHPQVVAIGEVGLDRQVVCPWQEQEDVFIRIIHLARETGKPLLIHARRSTERILELLKREGGGEVCGIFHAFSGSLEIAQKVIDLNFALGIGGVVTYATAKRLPQVIPRVPAEALVLETDAPDMAPEPYRGQQNRPAWLSVIAEKVACLRNWTLAETAQTTSANAIRILGLPQNGNLDETS